MVDTPTPTPTPTPSGDTTRPDEPAATAPTAEAEPSTSSRARLGGPKGEAGLDPYATRGETSLVPAPVAQGTEDLFHRLGRQSREMMAYLGGISKLSWAFVTVFYKRPWGMS